MKPLRILGTCAIALGIFTQPVMASSSDAVFNKTEEEILEEQRKELREMWDKHPAVSSDIQPTGIDPGYTGIGTKGDILISFDSITDHVAIVKDSYIVIEAHPDNPNEDVAYRDNNWKERYKEIKGMKVDGVTSTNKTNAVTYAERQLGDPYSLTTGRWTEDAWYCSKLVWRAWYEQGFDLEGRNLEARGTHVTPGDLLDSPKTTVFYSSY